jgi:AraC-like DNA-binding protein
VGKFFMAKHNNIIINDFDQMDSKYLIYTPSIDLLPFTITGAGHFLAKKDYLVDRKSLKIFLLIHTIEGEGELDYAGNHYLLKKGDIFLINCMNHHKYRTSIKHKKWEFKWIRFIGKSTLPFIKYINGNSFQLFNNFFDNQRYFDKVINLIQEQYLTDDFQLCNIVCNILTDLCNRFTSDLSLYKYGDTISLAKKYIIDNYKDKITIESLSSLFFINPFTFIRNFKKHLGISPYSFIINTRINKAQILLENSILPINEIALEIGFNDVNCFIRNFRSIVGITPLQYRKNFSSNAP